MSRLPSTLSATVARIVGPAAAIIAVYRMQHLLRQRRPGANLHMIQGGLQKACKRTLIWCGELLTPREKRGQKARLFMAGQQTKGLQVELIDWINEGKGPDGYESSRASLPPFNVGSGELLPGTKSYNVPVFGPLLNDAVMQLFEMPAMRKIAGDLHLRVPSYAFSTFVQGKLGKVRDLVQAAQQHHPQAAAATERLAAFCDALEALKPEQVTSRVEWEAFIARCGVADGWKSRLHFDHLLSNFGYDAETAAALRRRTIIKGEEEVTLEQHALRWLGKAFSCYQPDGCVADVVNLITAMMCADPPVGEEASEAKTLQRLREFGTRLVEKDFGDLWIPTHLHIDGELDDSMTWMVLRYVQDHAGESDLKVLLQLPIDAEFDAVADKINTNRKSLRKVRVYRDTDSRNAKAVTKGLVL